MAAGALPPAILARFRSVALERIERMSFRWPLLTQGGAGPELASELLRELHTLKGDSRVVGFSEVALVCHKLEDLLIFAKRRGFRVSEEIDLAVMMAISFLGMLVRKRDGSSVAGIDPSGFVAEIDSALCDAQSLPDPSAPAPSSRGVAALSRGQDRLSAATRDRFACAATLVFLEQLRATGGARARLYEAWRILNGELSALNAVPLAERLMRHRAAVAELAELLGKRTACRFDLGDVRVAAEVAEALDTAVLHALRNAVDHGIEDPAARRATGKPEEGRIVVSASADAHWVELVVEDDGRGIDFDVVLQRGIETGIVPESAAASTTQEELIELLLQSGFSTRSDITDVSGRGLGLDAARAALASLDGHVWIRTAAGTGTAAVFRVPTMSRSISVHIFPARPGAPVLAVEDDWTPSLDPDVREAFNPLDRLGIAATVGAMRASTVVRLRRDEHDVRLEAGGEPRTALAERFCPTPDALGFEVILVDGIEAILLRPDVLWHAPLQAAAWGSGVASGAE